MDYLDTQTRNYACPILVNQQARVSRPDSLDDRPGIDSLSYNQVQ